MIYTDRISNNYVIRTFSKDVDSNELLWHRDQESRMVKSLTHTDWQIQLENSLPISLNDPVLIVKERWHRLLKGNGDLKLEITIIHD